MKVTWVKETPTEEGWYWMQYLGRENRITQCPANVILFTSENDGLNGALVISARNDTWVEGPMHGGPGLKNKGKLDNSVRFGPKIEEPDYSPN